MKMKLNTADRITSFGLWVPTRDGGYKCGNVKVAISPSDRPWKTWFVFVRSRNGRWVKRMPSQRQWGYGHPGRAKIGAALMAKYQKNEVG